MAGPQKTNIPAARRLPSPEHREDRAAILDLQRTAGNAAVTTLIESATGRRRSLRVGQVFPALHLQRYEAGEHAQFGARKGKKERTFTINSVKVSYGEMIAMGDFFENHDELRKFAAAQPEDFTQLVQLIRREKVFFTNPDALPEKLRRMISTPEWEWALRKQPAGQQYLDMAGKNVTHFAPPPLPAHPGLDHAGEWRKYHVEAIQLALEGKMDDAMETNAFGDHFLTDAFSAGHLINKANVMATAKANLGKLQNESWHLIARTEFSDKVADGLLAKAPDLQNYEIRILKHTAWYDMNHESLTEIITGISRRADLEEMFLSLWARLVHDRLNEDIHKTPEGKVEGGVEVENLHGQHWRLSGDATLSLSPDTLRIGRQAVRQSQKNILTAGAHKGKSALDVQGLADLVWAYVPHPSPTPEGAGKVDLAIQQVTDPTRADTIDRFVDLCVVNLPTLEARLRGEGLLRFKEPRQWEVKQTDLATVGERSVSDKIDMIKQLLSGYVRDRDVEATVRILESVYTEDRPPEQIKAELAEIRDKTADDVKAMTSARQQLPIEVALVFNPAKVKSPAAAGAR